MALSIYFGGAMKPISQTSVLAGFFQHLIKVTKPYSSFKFFDLNDFSLSNISYLKIFIVMPITVTAATIV